MYIPPRFLDICNIAIKTISDVHAVSTNHIEDISHFNKKTIYSLLNLFNLLLWEMTIVFYTPMMVLQSGVGNYVVPFLTINKIPTNLPVFTIFSETLKPSWAHKNNVQYFVSCLSIKIHHKRNRKQDWFHNDYFIMTALIIDYQ